MAEKMENSSKFWFLKNNTLFSNLTTKDLSPLEFVSSLMDITKLKPIYFAEEPSSSIFFVKKGRVKLTRSSDDGRQMILGIINQGEIFGELSVFGEGERTDFAYAMEDCLICAISKSHFIDFLSRNPEVNSKLIKLISARLNNFSKRIEQLVFKDSAQRVSSFIADYGKKYGNSIGDEIFVKPFFTHKDLAEICSCSRQTVNSILNELKEAKIINFDRRKLVICNFSELKSRT